MGTDELVAVAYLNHGRWVANCPQPACLNAEQEGRTADGTPGGLDAASFYCRPAWGGCGLRCRAVWPAQRTQIEALVTPRPVPATRNWRPGETLEQLLAENLTHGIESTPRQTTGG